MRRFGIFWFNLLLGSFAASVIGYLLKPAPFMDVFARFGIAGLVIGATVGVGAVLGPRPPLRPSKCALAQLGVAVSSGVGGFIGSLFPQMFAEADQAVHSMLENRGIVVGSWFGAALGTLLSILNVYRMRRRSAGRSR